MWRWAVVLGLVQMVAVGQQKVPSVGCPSDGQQGPIEPPPSATVTLRIKPSEAQKLAYYVSDQGIGVLGPRGWFCFGTYGSSGQSIFVSPKPIDSENWFKSSNLGFDGPAIQHSFNYGDTSGRYTVADFIARLFPKYRWFIAGNEADLFEGETIPSGPYKRDKLNRQSDSVIEYTTPGGAEGLGGRSFLRLNDQPIDGVLILDGDVPNLLRLAVRLPPELRPLSRVIVKEAERDARNKSTR